MENLKPYKITKQSSDGTFLPGDIIWVSPNGNINLIQGMGWIIPSEVKQETLDFKYEETNDYEVVKINGAEICRKISEA